ncbi:thiamine pyrophosphokinase 1-like protein [Backusella circina FSU 941]|nr:thiamine pyrophosphokinase 1-like protein [Backusella circina FSU 941]
MMKNAVNIIKHWCPSNILVKEGKIHPFCLIVLNQPIIQLDVFQRLWLNASWRFVADGASNRLYDAFKHDEQQLQKFLPDEIRGDMDSTRPEVRAYYESKGVKITRVEDQNSNDFMKCVALLKEKEKESDKIFDIVACPALGGRFDQTIACINVLYMMKHEVERRFVLVSDNNLTMLLDEGKHQVHCQLDLEGPICGVLPIGSPATLTTKGLQYNMDHLKCEYGGVVSSSNSVISPVVEIETDAPVIWTIEIKYD